MHHPSHQEVCVLHLKREVILHGIVHPRLLYARMLPVRLFAFQLLSVLIQGKH